ncbi:acyltransferase family protein [Paraburkholderia aromaticivorans]|uniref:acyltransferase family protein n=1 Tax=Paraburkholderia aromaticivorans TaxID=2026199 RepID=UPI001455E105|nr:acyltransferase [Paraburkholderia aromaticivorans]
MATSEKSGLPNVGQVTSSSAGRYAFIDVLRGVAACLVVFQHGGESVGWFSTTTGIGPEVNFGQIGVLTFFLVSGFVIPLSLERANSLGKFWKHRAFRIYPLYLVIFALEFLRCIAGQGPFSLGAVHNLGLFFLSHLFFLQDYVYRPNFVGASWTLAMEFAWYIMLSAAFVIRANRRSVFLTVITVLGLLTLSAASYVLHLRIPLGRCGIMATCVVGLLFYRLHTSEISFRTFLILVGSIIGAIVPALYVGFGVFDRAEVATVQSVFISWGIAYLLFMGCYAARKQSVMRFRPLLALGTISYSVYLLHPLVESLISSMNVQGTVFMAILFLVTIVLSSLTYRYIEKPGIEYPRRVERKKQERLEIQAQALAND